MEVRGKKIKKRYILLVVLAALIVPRCVQMNMEETALKEKLAAGGFDNKYEMENIVGSGFTTKAEFDKFVQTTPIPSSEGESTVQCAAVASFWEDRELSLKTNIGDLTPKSIRAVINSDLIYDYAVGKTTNSILTARRDYLIKQLEQQFEKAGVTNALKANYLECHEKFGPYVEKKCGTTGVCDESTELLGLNGKPLTEDADSPSEDAGPTDSSSAASSEGKVVELAYNEKNCKLISALSASNAQQRIARKLEVAIASIEFIGPKWDYYKYGSSEPNTCYLQFDTPVGPLDCQLRNNDILSEDGGRTAYGDLFSENLCYK